MAAVMVILFSIAAPAQVQRNPLLEYVTGTWCGWCPCGHSIIASEILPEFPNTIVLGYHGPSSGSDPFRTFQGNQIITLLGFQLYPSGIIDRTSTPLSRGDWKSRVQQRQSVPADVDINIAKTYDETTRTLNLTVNATAVNEISIPAILSIVITEDGLRAEQSGNTTCPGGNDYVHNNVVRGMLNGARGDTLNNGVWLPGVTISRDYRFLVPAGITADMSSLVLFIYKENQNLNRSEVIQAEQWALPGTLVPVELLSFSAEVSKGSIVLSWSTATEVNNKGFEIERSAPGSGFIKRGFVPGAGTSSTNNSYSFSDKIEGGTGTYYYRLKQTDLDGSFEYSKVINVDYDIPFTYSLEQNYPNPFNPATLIRYSTASREHISITVFDMLGRKIASLVNEIKDPGIYESEFSGEELPSGIYFYRITAGSYTESKKMNLVK